MIPVLVLRSDIEKCYAKVRHAVCDPRPLFGTLHHIATLSNCPTSIVG